MKSSRLVACTASPGSSQHVPCAGRHTLPSCPLNGPSVSVSARSVHGSAVHLRVYSVYGPAAHYPLVRYTASRPVHGPATHIPAPSVPGPAVSVPSSSVYDPAVHFAPGLCTAQPRNPNASFHAQFRHALADVFCARPHHAPPYCPLHGPAMGLASRSVYGPPTHLAPGCVWPCRAILTPRCMHSSVGHLPTCSVCGPDTPFPLVRYTAPP